MELYDDLSGYNSLFLCGDIHGECKTLLYEIKREGISDAIVLVAEDCGIGFEKPAHYEQLYQRLKRALQQTNCLLLLTRGNHDDPEYFQHKSIDFPSMKNLPDYSVIHLKQRSILRVGGAISVDRSERLMATWLAGLKGRTVTYYWENEKPIFDINLLSKLKSKDIQVDIVVTHSTPSFCMPLLKTGIENWLLEDEHLEADIAEERQVMDSLYNWLFSERHPVKNWFYGHFNDSHVEYISDIRFQMLNIMELYELDSRIAVQALE